MVVPQVNLFNDISEGCKACSYCGLVKLHDEFYREGPRRMPGSRCKVCERAYSRDRARAKRRDWHAHQLRYKYGLSVEQYEAMLAEQDGRCAICGTDDPGVRRSYFCVDHDRGCCPESKTCGRCVRGLLCNGCNVGMGGLQDDPYLLDIAVAYLRACGAPRII